MRAGGYRRDGLPRYGLFEVRREADESLRTPTAPAPTTILMMGRRVAIFGAVFGLAGIWALSPVAASPAPKLTQRTIPDIGVTVGLPASWVGAAPPASASAFGVKYVYRAREVVSAFKANVNLIVDSLPKGMSLRQWLFQGASSAMQYVGTTRSVTVSGLPGLHYESTKAQKYGSVPLLTDQWAVVRDQHVFLFTYTALASTRARYEPLFSASAKSIRVTLHPLTRVTA